MIKSVLSNPIGVAVLLVTIVGVVTAIIVGVRQLEDNKVQTRTITEVKEAVEAKKTLELGALVKFNPDSPKVYRVDRLAGRTAILRHIPSDTAFVNAECDWGEVFVLADAGSYDYEIGEPYQGGDFAC